MRKDEKTMLSSSIASVGDQNAFETVLKQAIVNHKADVSISKQYQGYE